MNKKIILVIGFIGFINLIFSQQIYPTTKVAEEFMSRTLIVELNPEEAYENEDKEAVNNYYKLLKEVFNEWTLTPIEFKSKEDIDKIVKSKSKEYSILVTTFKMKEVLQGRDFLETEIFSFAIYLSEKGNKRDKYYLDVSGEMSIQRGPYVFNVSLLDRPQKASEIEFVKNQFENEIPIALDKKILKQKINERKRINVDKIINRTLLIAKEDLDIDESVIKENYSHKFKIVSRAEIDKYIEQKDTNFIYFEFILSPKYGKYQYAVIDIETNNILEDIPGLTTNIVGSIDVKTLLTKRDFKALEGFVKYKSEAFKVK